MSSIDRIVAINKKRSQSKNKIWFHEAEIRRLHKRYSPLRCFLRRCKRLIGDLFDEVKMIYAGCILLGILIGAGVVLYVLSDFNPFG